MKRKLSKLNLPNESVYTGTRSKKPKLLKPMSHQFKRKSKRCARGKYAPASGRKATPKQAAALAKGRAKLAAKRRPARAQQKRDCLKVKKEALCDTLPACDWRKHGKAKKASCGARKGGRKGAVYQGPVGPSMASRK